MDDRIKNLKGSESRDKFKMLHKRLDRRLYSCDADFVFVKKGGPVAYVDYKKKNDKITWTEHQLYTYWAKDKPVYIITGDNIDAGEFVITQYIDENNNGKFVARVNSWEEFETWELKLRGLR